MQTLLDKLVKIVVDKLLLVGDPVAVLCGFTHKLKISERKNVITAHSIYA